MTLNIALRVALGSGIIFTKFDLRQFIRAWIIVLCGYVMSRCDLYLWPVTLKVTSTSSVTLSKSVRSLREIEQSQVELLIILPFLCTCYVKLWPLDLELLKYFGCHALVYKICTTDRRRRFSRVRGPNFTKLGEDIGRSSPYVLCLFHSSGFGYLAAFSKRTAQSWLVLKNTPNFRTFWHPVKIRGKVGEISGPIVEAKLRPNLRNGHPLRGCWARWIDKKRKKKKVHQ